MGYSNILVVVEDGIAEARRSPETWGTDTLCQDLRPTLLP